MASASAPGKVLVTGASGFVGTPLVATLRRHGWSVVSAVRYTSGAEREGVHVVGDIDARTDWRTALDGCDCVIHLAARVHVMDDDADDPLAAYRETNVSGTLNLARQAVESGVRRFVFLSSIKVNGEASLPGQPFTPDDRPNPEDGYAISKYEAEQGLQELASRSDMDVVIIRPPLVYGPGVKANFRSMMNWLATGIPLPFGALHNRRSLVGVDNLVDLIRVCLTHPAAANQVFLVSDGEDVSTAELLRRTAVAMGKKARLLPLPGSLLEWVAHVLGKGKLAQRLCGSLQVDISKTKERLNWTPPVGVDEGLRRAAEGME